MSTLIFDIPEKRTFTPTEVAEFFDVNPRTVRRWCERGDIEFIRIGPRNIRIRRECVIAIIGTE